MGKFDVTAAAGNAANTEEAKVEEQAEAPAAAKPAAKKATTARKPAAKKPAAKKAPARRATQKKSVNVETEMSKPTGVLNELLEEAEVQAAGMSQIAVRMPPALKTRLKSATSRAGLKQEKFVAALISSGLDELEAILEAREKA